MFPFLCRTTGLPKRQSGHCFFFENQGLDLGLNQDGLVHGVVEVLNAHLSQNSVHSVQQEGVALDYGDTDVARIYQQPKD